MTKKNKNNSNTLSLEIKKNNNENVVRFFWSQLFFVCQDERAQCVWIN